MDDEDDSYFGPLRSGASNPARVRVHFGKFLASHPGDVAWALLPPVIVFAVAAFAAKENKPLALAIIAVVGAGYAAFQLYQLHVHFLTGDVCPAVVVSDRPYRVAVYTDLGREGHHPAVRVVSEPLAGMTGGPPAVGDRLAAVSMYAGVVGDRWGEFTPRVVNCATANEAAVRRVLDSIPEEDWRELDRWVARLPTPAREGLFLFDPDTGACKQI